MGCICDKAVIFFGEDSRDTSHLVCLLLTMHIHDLRGLKIDDFAQSKTTRREEWFKRENKI